MNPKVIHAAVSLTATLLAACGGGTDIAPTITATASSVRIEGCITDAAGRPTATTVRALGADGRPIADASSNADGVFELRVPLQGDISLLADEVPDDALTMRVGSTDVSVAGCLRRTAG